MPVTVGDQLRVAGAADYTTELLFLGFSWEKGLMGILEELFLDII